MKVTYFQDTDTLYIALGNGSPVETKELNNNVLIELDDKGGVVAITIEHARETSGNPKFSYEEVLVQ